MKKIKLRQKKIREERTMDFVTQLELPKNAQMFECARILAKKTTVRYEVIDGNGFTQTEAEDTIRLTTEFYEKMFNRENDE